MPPNDTPIAKYAHLSVIILNGLQMRAMEYIFVAMLKQYFSLAAVLIILFSCGNAASKESAAGNKKISERPPVEKSDTLTWINDFRAFRDAVYHNERAKVKGFVDFPIVNPGNDIWYIVYAGDVKEMPDIPDSKPFTEKDLDKYYNKIFTNTFIKCLLKIKTEELYRKGEIASPDLKAGNSISRLSATVDKTENTLELNLYTEAPYKNGDGEMEKSEYAVMFKFRILKTGKIKLYQIFGAG